VSWCALFFFFQAEDGIRDYKVTGVQTCALPIYFQRVERELDGGRLRLVRQRLAVRTGGGDEVAGIADHEQIARLGGSEDVRLHEIGRAAGRGKGEISVGGRSFKKKKKRDLTESV